MSLAAEFEQAILENSRSSLEAQFPGEGFVLPHYGGLSIVNLAATITSLLGAADERGISRAGLEPPLPRQAWAHLAEGVNCVILVVLDAVGYLGFRRLLEAGETGFGPLAPAGIFVPLTSVFPSTTMAALSSLWTGRTPADHGFLGRRLFLSEYGFVADMIGLRPALHGRPGSLMDWGWVPEAFLPVPYLAQLLSLAGGRTIAHLYAPHIGGGLSRLFLQGVDSIVGFLNTSDMWVNVRHSAELRRERPLLVSVYWAGTDDMAHTYGPNDERFEAAVRQVAHSFERDFLAPLSPAARKGTVVIVTGDHGQVETPPECAVRLEDHPKLKEMLLWPPCAEPRASYLHVRPTYEVAAYDYVAEHLADQFVVLDMALAISAGLFGPSEMPLESRRRLGNLLLLARGDSRLIPVGTSAQARGEHGSLLPEEMLVPLLMARLDS